jgi:hypothetical protein
MRRKCAMPVTECGCPCHLNPSLAEKHVSHGCCSDMAAAVSEPYVGGEI